MTALTWFAAGCAVSTVTLIMLAQWLARRSAARRSDFETDLMAAWSRRNIAAERTAVATERIARKLEEASK